ncbi:MAG: SEL1-like repeat protein [Lachnospiraceae bacterium]|nr:SEL1-like repeat protein [Lachnospiraceae bacterium]
MDIQMKKDIFISYRNDGSGNQFANRLCKDLEDRGYSVYFNSNEGRSHSFPERLKNAIVQCKDFVLVMSKGCLDKLKIESAEIDWVKEELLTAWKNQKHIIPILLEGVDMPASADELPSDLNFLPYIDAIRFPEQYLKSPFSELTGALLAKQDGKERYKDSFNNNERYSLKEDLNELLQAAKDGDVRAMYEVGLLYYYGATDESGSVSGWDYDKAVHWLKKVSESDHELRYHADNIIARLYYLGAMPGEPQSYEKSYEYHVKAAPKSPYSASNQVFMMRNGIGCEYDYNKIVDFYANNTNQNDDVMLRMLAEFLTKHGKYAEAMEVYDSMTVLSPEAQYNIGQLYRDGVIYDPPQPDPVQAAYYFREAADSNHINAAYEYGLLCFRPNGRFRKNFRNAEKYLKMAADSGHAEAQYVLGFMYKGGHVTKDYNKAILYFEMAKEKSNSWAALELACMYQQPECQNYQRAYECAEIAASRGLGEGEFILGNLLFWGRGCEADMNKAYEMYGRAYEHGFYDGLIMQEKIEKIKGC